MENENIKIASLEKKILLVETLFVFGVFVYLFFSMMPSAISPISGQVVSDPDFVFEIENGDQIIISRDVGFTNPIVLEEGSDILLPPGVYYWKVKGILRESEVKTFTIEGNVGLNLREGEVTDRLENAGNVDAEVSGGITGTIGVGESVEVEKDQSFEGGQYEK
jgi:hypothetical protein